MEHDRSVVNQDTFHDRFVDFEREVFPCRNRHSQRVEKIEVVAFCVLKVEDVVIILAPSHSTVELRFELSVDGTN